MVRLDLNRSDNSTGIRSRIADIYSRVTGGSNDHQRNDRSLELIQFCVITISAIATGGVNAFAHRERLGWTGASLLAILLMGFVEKFYFTLRHGLATVYRSRKQRFVAATCYRLLQASMIANAAILCAWITDWPLPEPLAIWRRLSIVLHFGIALFGVSAVRDYDAVAENRIREIKAAAAERDLISIRRAAAGDHPLLLLAARIRGWIDGMKRAVKLLKGDYDHTFHSTPHPNLLPDNSLPLCLPGETEEPGPRKVTDISGKGPRR